MISDVLSDGVAEIERYQKHFPDMYDSLEDDIEKVKEAMRELRRKLDDPGSVEGNPKLKEVK